MRKPRRTTPATIRFWRKVVKTENCWNWVGGIARSGYGFLAEEWPKRTNIGAHRFSWIIHNGPIREGDFICHKCDNRLCVNPSHLFSGKRKDNISDMVTKGRQAKGQSVGTAKMTDWKIRQIRSLYSEKRYDQWDLSEIFGIGQVTINHIVNGKTWKHLV